VNLKIQDMEEFVTKEDLRHFRMLLINDIGKLLEEKTGEGKAPQEDMEWLRSKAIRRIMDISPGTLQNLRITGKIRFKKVMGSYYYNRSDVSKLFNGE